MLVDADGFVDAQVGSLQWLIGWAEPVEVIAVDIPIGNVPGGGRRCDREARALLGPRASSVFPAAPVEVLTVTEYDAANRVLTDMGAPKLSRQAWALVPKIVEAASVAAADGRMFEVHPEVSFRALAGEPVSWSKKSWNGLQLRRSLLADAGVVVPDLLPALGGVVADDVVDAAVAAWSALRIAQGTAQSVPHPPEESDGRPVAIWY